MTSVFRTFFKQTLNSPNLTGDVAYFHQAVIPLQYGVQYLSSCLTLLPPSKVPVDKKVI